MITERQLAILQSIIDEYILTGVPVGSRTLSKRVDMNLSSATIRNEMADLEEYGYLEQPHASAGRKPTEKAYRLYVDTLMKVSRLNQQEVMIIKHYFDKKVQEIENVIETTAKALSDLTNMTAVVMSPQLKRDEIKRIQIVKLSEQKALLVFVFSTGMVKDVMVQIDEDIDAQYLEMLSSLLTEKVQNLPAEEAVDAVRDILYSDLPEHRRFLNALLSAVGANVRSRGEVVLGGAKNIFNHPEYKDVDKAKSFLSLLETKDKLYDMLRRAKDMEFTIKIGTENELDQLKDMSVVTATYKIGNENIGSFGIIGPTRMDYGKIVSIMSCIGSSMNDILKSFLSIDE